MTNENKCQYCKKNLPVPCWTTCNDCDRAKARGVRFFARYLSDLRKVKIKTK